MSTFASRRFRNLALFCAVTIFVVTGHTVLETALLQTTFFTGWFLAGLIVLLAAYNIYKRFPFLPLGSSSTWLQLHIYSGLLTSVLFLLHIGGRWPSGLFERLLAVVYLAVFLSGIVGLALTRTLPRRLSIRGEEVIFERIPTFIRQLREQVEQLVCQCVEETGSTAVPDFYLKHLKSFFERPRNLFNHLMHSEHPRHQLMTSLQEHSDFLNEAERKTMQQIGELVMTKDDLDFHYSLQAVLKYWFFVHVPATYSLMVLMVFHAILAHSFS
ncbi:MAG: hypothetical protein Tsb009_28780 [Planctomycetaceae bacterium]